MGNHGLLIGKRRDRISSGRGVEATLVQIQGSRLWLFFGHRASHDWTAKLLASVSVIRTEHGVIAGCDARSRAA